MTRFISAGATMRPDILLFDDVLLERRELPFDLATVCAVGGAVLHPMMVERATGNTQATPEPQGYIEVQGVQLRRPQAVNTTPTPVGDRMQLGWDPTHTVPVVQSTLYG